MTFVDRARALYESDDRVGAAVALMEGLKRRPDHAEAFRWLLDLYCEELTSPGLENDLVQVVDVCPDPNGVYRLIFTRLQRAERHRFAKLLDRARRDAARARGEFVPTSSFDPIAPALPEPYVGGAPGPSPHFGVEPQHHAAASSGVYPQPYEGHQVWGGAPQPQPQYDAGYDATSAGWEGEHPHNAPQAGYGHHQGAAWGEAPPWDGGAQRWHGHDAGPAGGYAEPGHAPADPNARWTFTVAPPTHAVSPDAPHQAWPGADAGWNEAAGERAPGSYGAGGAYPPSIGPYGGDAPHGAVAPYPHAHEGAPPYADASTHPSVAPGVDPTDPLGLGFGIGSLPVEGQRGGGGPVAGGGYDSFERSPFTAASNVMPDGPPSPSAPSEAEAEDEEPQTPPKPGALWGVLGDEVDGPFETKAGGARDTDDATRATPAARARSAASAEDDLMAHPLLVRRQRERERSDSEPDIELPADGARADDDDDTGASHSALGSDGEDQPRKKRWTGRFGAISPKGMRFGEVRVDGPSEGLSDAAETSDAHRAPPPEPVRPVLNDPEAVESLDRAVSAAWTSFGAMEGRASRDASSKGPPKWLPRAIVLSVAALVVILAGVNLFLGSDSPSESEPSAVSPMAASERYVWSSLEAKRSAAREAFDDDTDSQDAAAKLLWARALQRYMYPAGAPETSETASEPKDKPEQLPKLDKAGPQSWAKAASVLDALSAQDAPKALDHLNALRGQAGVGKSDVPDPVLNWLTGEVALGHGNLERAQDYYTRAASAGFVPGVVGVADVCVRRADVPCVAVQMSTLRGKQGGAGEDADPAAHPAQVLGMQVVPVLQEMLEAPSRLEPTRVAPLEPSLQALALHDRRLVAWVRCLRQGDAAPKTWDVADSAHPSALLLEARALFHARRVESALKVFGRMDMSQVTKPLRAAAEAMLIQGPSVAGRPDLALARLPALPSDGALAEYVRRSPGLALQRASLLAEVGDFKTARALLSPLFSEGAHAREARLVAIGMHLHEGNSEDVERHVDRLGSGGREARVAEAALRLFQGDPAGALDKLGESEPEGLPKASRQPHLRELEVRVRLLALKALGKREAVERWLADVDVSPALRVRLLGRAQTGDALRQISIASPTRLDDLIDLAFEALDSGHYSEARVWARRVLEVVSGDAQAHRVLARVAFLTGASDQAREHLQAAARGRPSHPDLASGIPRLLIMDGKYVVAAKRLRKHLKRSPEDAHAVALLGEALYYAKHLTIGARELKGMVRKLDAAREPMAVGDAYYWLARLSRSAKGDERGGTYLARAHELVGDRTDVLVELGHFHRHANGDKALEFYEKASQAEDAPAEAHLALARLALGRKRKALAQTALERYLNTGPKGEKADWAQRQLKRLR